jgi:hypothetical protein
MYSGLVFQSKTIRTMVFVPIALGVEKRFNFPPMSLALPVAMLIEHCYVLPSTASPPRCCTTRTNTARPMPSSTASR